MLWGKTTQSGRWRETGGDILDRAVTEGISEKVTFGMRYK
jgi:hypothetical protein